MACTGGTVTSTFPTFSASRVGIRAVCASYEIPPEAVVTEQNSCYLRVPTEVEYPRSIDARLAAWAAVVSQLPAFSWSTPSTQLAYFSNGWFVDCSGSPMLGGVMGSATFPSSIRASAELEIVRKCQRGPTLRRVVSLGGGE